MGGGLVRSLMCKYCLRGGALTNEFLQIPTQCPIAPQESVVGSVIDRRITARCLKLERVSGKIQGVAGATEGIG